MGRKYNQDRAEAVEAAKAVQREHDQEIPLGSIDPESALGKAIREASSKDITVTPEIGVQHCEPWDLDATLRAAHLQIEHETWDPQDDDQ